MNAESLHASPNALAQHYSMFRVAERVLLSGHSHQAWPDVAFEAQQQAFVDAAEHVDEKWARAFERADRVRQGYATLLNDRTGSIALAPSTHDLLIKLFSALPFRRRRRIVTTDGEFHAARRQFDRLGEEGVEIVRVAAQPVDTLSERLAEKVDDSTLLAMVSSVFFMNAQIVPNLRAVAAACARHGADLVVDAYHHLNIVPFDIREDGLENAFITGGGYKYCQLGEGNGFLRIPAGRELRPVFTGWFSEFSALTQKPGEGVTYGSGGDVLAGATYDPTSNYRAARVFEFFQEKQLAPALLRAVSQHQIQLLASEFDQLDLATGIATRDRTAAIESIAGFLAIQSPHAGTLRYALRDRGIFTDHRGDVLRLGPAPYVSDEQLQSAIGALGEIARAL